MVEQDQAENSQGHANTRPATGEQRHHECHEDCPQHGAGNADELAIALYGGTERGGVVSIYADEHDPVAGRTDTGESHGHRRDIA